MKQLRYWVPVLGIFALIALFLMLPETPSVGCKSCSSSNPYIPLIGAGYFSILIVLSLLFPTFPQPLLARAGLTWAILLAAAFTYALWPRWCLFCLIGHACHILIWAIWTIVPAVKTGTPSSPRNERWCLLFFAPISIVALFSCLNLTFMAYGFKINHPVWNSGLRVGEKAPAFSMKTMEGSLIVNRDAKPVGKLILNFVSPDCPHCKEQLEMVNAALNERRDPSYRFINVASHLSLELIHYAPTAEWIEDKEGHLGALFQVTVYPTLFAIGDDGNIAEIFLGSSDQLKVYLSKIFLPIAVNF